MVKKKLIDEIYKPYFLPGGTTSCLMIHGLGSGPYTLRPLAEFLNKHDITVNSVLLEGHGTKPEDLRNKSIRKEIYKSAFEGAKTLKKMGFKKIFVIGHSLGGMIALEMLSKNNWIKGGVILKSPLQLKDWEEKIISFLSKGHSREFIPLHPFNELYSVHKFYLKHKRYSKIPIKTLYDITKYMKYIKKRLKYIKQPLLLIYSKKDKLGGYDTPKIIEEKANSKKIRKIILERSGHTTLFEADRKKVRKSILQFIKAYD